MSGPKFGEFGRHTKKKVKIGDLEDGPSSFRSSPYPPWHGWHGMENIPNGGIDDSGVSAWKQEEGGGEELELDPLMVFGSGIMTMILSKLEAPSVAQSRLVSCDWLAVASSDKIWAPKDLFHKFINGILNGDPIQIIFCFSVWRIMVHCFGNDVLPTMRDRPSEKFFFTFVYVYYTIMGRNKEAKVFPFEAVSELELLSKPTSSDGLSESEELNVLVYMSKKKMRTMNCLT